LFFYENAVKERTDWVAGLSNVSVTYNFKLSFSSMVDAQFNLNLFDVAVCLVMFFSAVISLYRGFIGEFLSLVTWFGAGMFTLAMADKSTAFMKQYMQSGLGAAVIGIMGTYFLTIIVLGMLSRVLLRYVKDGADVGWPDHMLGLVFGLLKGGMVVVLGFILMTLVFKQGYPDWVQTARTLPMVQQVTLKVVKMMPEYLGSISSLGEAQPPLEGGEQPPLLTPQQIDQNITQDIQALPPKQTVNGVVDPAAPPQQSPLEQLIQDVTKDRPTQE
jgi:membrane protein required for colicin V production